MLRGRGGNLQACIKACLPPHRTKEQLDGRVPLVVYAIAPVFGGAFGACRRAGGCLSVQNGTKFKTTISQGPPYDARMTHTSVSHGVPFVTQAIHTSFQTYAKRKCFCWSCSPRYLQETRSVQEIHTVGEANHTPGQSMPRSSSSGPARSLATGDHGHTSALIRVLSRSPLFFAIESSVRGVLLPLHDVCAVISSCRIELVQSELLFFSCFKLHKLKGVLRRVKVKLDVIHPRSILQMMHT